MITGGTGSFGQTMLRYLIKNNVKKVKVLSRDEKKQETLRLELKNNKIAVCYLNGEFTVKRVRIEKDHIYLVPENDKYEPIKVTDENEFIVWGIVTYVIKKI